MNIKTKMWGIPDRWLLFPLVGTFIIFLLKLISFSEILTRKTVDIVNFGDMAMHVSLLFFLDEYGFHNIVPLWYDGFRLFHLYPSASFFFLLPLYQIISDVNLVVFVSYILLIIIAFVAVWFLGRYNHFSKLKTITFFVLLFMNPIIIDYIFVGGRFPEFFAWVIFSILLAILSYLKYNKSNYIIFFLIIITLSVLILSHPYVSLFGLLLTFLAFLTAKFRINRYHLIFSVILALAFTSFWWIPFIYGWLTFPSNIPQLTDYQFGELLDIKNSIFSFNTAVIFSWFFIFYLYWKQSTKIKREKVFYYPLLLLSFLILFRIISFIPFLNQIPPNSYNIFFISLTLLTFFKIKKFNMFNKRAIIISLILLPLISSIIVFEVRPQESYEFTNQKIKIIELLPENRGRYLLIDDIPPHSILKNIIAYATIHYNLSTPTGVYHPATSKKVYDTLETIGKNLNERDCKELSANLDNLKVTTLISKEEKTCEILKQCNFKEVYNKEVCMFLS